MLGLAGAAWSGHKRGMLPWGETKTPLMLAPMQGLTNRGMRHVVAQLGQPDVLFTEFVRVRPGARRVIAPSDFVEACTTSGDIPLVVQVIGSAEDGVVEATQDLIDRGVRHINVNMGCPYGRMTSVLAGGGMFRHPETVAPMLRALREIVPGSLSVKTRAGLEAPDEIFSLLPAFAQGGLDFLVIHPRTVAQRYRGGADHAVTARLVEEAGFPIVANGDVTTPAEAEAVLARTGAAGLMLGRGAIQDPLLFERIRGRAPRRPRGAARQQELARFLGLLVAEYADIFHGDAQVIAKLKRVLGQLDEPEHQRWLKGLVKQKRVDRIQAALAEVSS